MSGDPATVGLGLALVAAGVDWRVRAGRRRRGDFHARARAALNGPDPAARRAAVTVVVQQGLAEVAELLLEAIRCERDSSVLDAIAVAVARNQWEPSHHAGVFELRLWAHHRLEVRVPPRAQRTVATVPESTPIAPAPSAHEPLVSNGHRPPAIAGSSWRRALGLIATDGWRRLTHGGALRQDGTAQGRR